MMISRTNLLAVSTVLAVFLCSSTVCRIISLSDEDERSSTAITGSNNNNGDKRFFFVDPFHMYFIRYPKRSGSPENSNPAVTHIFDKKGRPGSPLRFGKRNFIF
uniref:Uncharacterized protein n=1 Tax=Romanomermis culicivorax TaxID=13658 RepID=A0A915HTC9_ROMCU